MKSKKHRANVVSDNTVMWFGVHKGKRLKDIPNSYFKYLLESDISFKGIKNYTLKRLSKSAV
jgi:uncharacterized protein (DUF3820 family)